MLIFLQSAPARPRPENEPCAGFWNSDIISSIPCISYVKKFAFYDFHGMGNKSELSFIKSVAQTCNSLEHMLIITRGSVMEPPDCLKAHLINTMSQVEWASKATTLNIIAGNHKEWDYKTASDVSLSDPFDYMS